MEMLIFLNGALFALNMLLYWRFLKKPKVVASAETNEDASTGSTQKQWNNLLSYNGDAQGVNENDN